MRTTLALTGVVALLAGGYFHLAREYPLSLALIMALAAGALTWSVVRTAERLRSARPPDRR